MLRSGLPLLLQAYVISGALGGEVAASVVGGTQAPALRQLWRRELPLQPIRLTLVGKRRTAVVGMRNCPDDTQDSAWMLDLRNGSRLSNGGLAGGADVVAARRSPDRLPLAAAACGWDKASTTTTMQLMLAPGRLAGDQQAEPQSVSGDPAMWRSTAISEDGRVGAVLYEPAPDTAHLNNRSSVLRIYSGDCATLHCQHNASWELRVDGLGATDPQEVAISAESSRLAARQTTNGTRAHYIIAAIMGSEQIVVAFDVGLPVRSRVIHRRSGGEIPVCKAVLCCSALLIAAT